MGQSCLKKVFSIAKTGGPMSVDSNDFQPEKTDGLQRRFAEARSLWPRLIDLWLSAVLVAFFLIRILGSQTAKRLLSGLHHSHMP